MESIRSNPIMCSGIWCICKIMIQKIDWWWRIKQHSIDLTLINSIGTPWIVVEIIVPKLKSYKIVDIAKAINPKNKINVIGIKRGEKIHEELINEHDAPYTIDIGKYYLILPDNDKKTLNLYKNKFRFKRLKSNFKYTSLQKKFLTIQEIKKLISK